MIILVIPMTQVYQKIEHQIRKTVEKNRLEPKFFRNIQKIKIKSKSKNRLEPTFVRNFQKIKERKMQKSKRWQ